jgi:hypothetical protein
MRVAPVDLRDQEVARYLADGWGSEAKELAWVAVVVGAITCASTNDGFRWVTVGDLAEN